MNVGKSTATVARRTQAQRRAASRAALLEAAARGLSRYGYGDLSLEKVAQEAGYTRGALYHQFSGKEELARAVVAWVEESWWAEMGPRIAASADPRTAIADVSRAHAVFCRRDIARVRMVLSVEFSGRDHPVGRAVDEAMRRLTRRMERLVTAGRQDGSIPPGPPARVVALAILGAVEGVVINVGADAPFDEELAARAALGVLGP